MRGALRWRNVFSTTVTARMVAMAISRSPEAEEEKKQIVVACDRHCGQQDEQRPAIRNRVDREIAAQGGGRDGGERLKRVAADDQLESIERPGQGAVESRRDRRRRAAADQQAQILPPQADVLADFRSEARPDLGVGRLQASASAKADGDDRQQCKVDAVAQGHAAAIERVGLDRVDNLARAENNESRGDEADQKAARRRGENPHEGRNFGSGAQMGVDRHAEKEIVQPDNRAIDDRDDRPDGKAGKRRYRNQRDLVLTEPRLFLGRRRG